MWDLLSQLVSRMCIIVTIAFLITRLKAFRQMIHQRLNVKDHMVMIVVFGFFGVIGNYTGIVVNPNATFTSGSWISTLGSFNAIADTRNIGVIIGGIFGGPIVGLGAGIIAGVHRYLLGGFINTAVLIATIFGGIAAGWIGRKFPLNQKIRPTIVLAIGVVILTIQILLVPVFAVPHQTAFQLIQFTGFPIIFVNSIGIWICAMILYSVIREEERTRATQTQSALFIADKTLPFFRQGLNSYSSKKAATIIYKLTNVDAVSITNWTDDLVHVGKGTHTHSKNQVEMDATRESMETGKVIIAKLQKKFSSTNSNCPLKTAIILPLLVKQKAVGALKFYYIDANKVDSVAMELAEGLATLFSTQLELGEAERSSRLLQDAKIKALQAQIHPHFLFNSINIIAALCRTKPMLARDLLVHLGTFLRGNIMGARRTLVTVSKEFENVDAYLSLEQARFPNRYSLNKNVEVGLEDALIPPFTLQPLVENAIRHGFTKHHKKGNIFIYVEKQKEFLNIVVSDDGIGIPKKKCHVLGQNNDSMDGNGVGLNNIKERLTALFGTDGNMKIQSEVDSGTEVIIKIPLQFEQGKRNVAEII
ncbi:LytS/YhcK type 5TM receptor domain-containing protein [Aquibacillus albus]|uniref:histidine kinase n=1 Tax=Aquibacillus albus TaxID=1168171 RepID=A0ABS2MWC6_9BACI|nr:LytS/YhcK type 5TM receptor domain-containing protein [Aquibacillus albus]MBM7570177.1 two-component system LytT family sensor kinase/two-component system sensor histidine kinase LytS [Aquibacillus albus]